MNCFEKCIVFFFLACCSLWNITEAIYSKTGSVTLGVLVLFIVAYSPELFSETTKPICQSTELPFGGSMFVLHGFISLISDVMKINPEYKFLQQCQSFLHLMCSVYTAYILTNLKSCRFHSTNHLGCLTANDCTFYS